MTRIAAFSTADGNEVLIEVDDVDGRTMRGGPGELVERSGKTMEEVIERLRLPAEALVTKLRSVIDGPDEAEISFGVKLTAEAGVVIARGTGEANLSVTLRWTHRPPPPPPPAVGQP